MRPVVSVFAVGLAAVIGAQQIPTIRVPVRLVSVPTMVFTRESRIVNGLQAADFRILDNGRLQTPSLNTSSTPVSVALVIQVNQDVREYLPFIKTAGSAIEALLVGESGEAAVVTYGSEVAVVKPFDAGSVPSAFRSISANGRPARMVDGGIRALALLARRPSARTRVLLFIGQALDDGSESALAALREGVEKENVAVHALTLPEFGKAFVSDTFSLQGLSSKADRGGFKASADFGRLISVLNRSGNAAAGVDPFSVLVAATGGIQLHFRKQRQLEDAIAAIGIDLRSAYLLSYYPNSQEAGYHTVRVVVDVPGARVYSRPGYWLNTD